MCMYRKMLNDLSRQNDKQSKTLHLYIRFMKRPVYCFHTDKIFHRFILFMVCCLLFAASLLTTADCQPKYEFRAAWIATVVNTDWPSKKGLPVIQQKQEFINMLSMLQGMGMNAVIVQIRPAADAFYPSNYEPWSEWLTGVQGLPPEPYYDPLQFMIEEAHKRGMEFHAWLNPYRAVFDIRSSSVSSSHITKQHPEWFLTYGSKRYFNPGLPAVMDYVTRIVRDVISRYDIDAVHMDDYFYPYRITGKEFPDEGIYRKYSRGLAKDNWRRSNCDSIIKRIHDAILEVNPMVKFGISPFGVWRNADTDPEGSDTKGGQTNYDDLYADILLWLKKGWIDYVAPQLYWEIGHRLCDYETLLGWWAAHSYGKHVYIGHGIYRTIESPTAAWRNPKELPNQIKLLRDNAYIQGSIFFSAANFNYNPNGWNDSLANNYYKYPAIIPPMAWVDTVPPLRPVIKNLSDSKSGNEKNFIVQGESDNIKETQEVKSYVLYISDNLAGLGKHPFFILPATRLKMFQFNINASDIPTAWSNCYASVSCLDRENNESDLSNVVQFVKTNKGWMISKK